MTTVAEIVTDLGRWTKDLRDRVRTLPKAQRAEALDTARRLLASGLRHAPRHTGALRRSLRTVVRIRGTTTEAALWSDDPAAGDQDRGGTITASGRPMTVPIGEERARWDASGTRREASEVQGLFGIVAKNGKHYLVTKENGRLILRFALRWSVYQRGTGWARKATREAARGVEPGVRARYIQSLLARRAV